MPKREMPDDEVSLWVAVGAVIVLAVFWIIVSGCSVMPDHIVVRDEAGNKLAEADPATGKVTLTWYGLEALRPKIYMPKAKK